MSTSGSTHLAADFYAELTSRNGGFISAAAQDRLARAVVVVAGCGSTGGAVIDPLTRLGVQHFLLADPGTYELNNLNRQHARLGDLGRNKAEVGAEHIAAINPHAIVHIDTDGIGASTVDCLLETADIVIDGVDVTESSGMTAKWALHVSASRRRVPVISGYDMAGLQYVRLYDYRRNRAPLDGAITASDIASLSSWQLLDRLIPRRKIPTEMIQNLRGNLVNPGYHVPQLVYTSLLFAAVTTRMVTALLAGEPVRAQVSLDVHRSTRRLPGNIRQSLAKPGEVVRTLRQLKKMEKSNAFGS